MGKWDTIADGEKIDINKYIDYRDYATTAERDAASVGWDSSEKFRICTVAETGYFYYWSGASWQRFPASGGSGAPDDASYVTINAEDELSAETLHKNITGDNLHVTKAHADEHQSGGGDEVNVQGLSGVLADEQDAGWIKGDAVDKTGLADNDILVYDVATGKWKPETIPGGGDMTKAVYDTGDNGIVDNSEKLEGSTKAQVQTHTPANHITRHISGGEDPFTSAQLIEAIVKRVQESSGPTTLTVGNVSDGQYLQRSASTIIGAAGTAQAYKLVPSYTIYKVGGLYKAMDADGNIPYSDANAATVINNALGNLTAGRIWKEKVLLKGTFDISSTINVPSHTILEINGRLELTGDVDLIKNSGFASGSNTKIDIIGGVLDGNKTARSGSLTGINFKTCDFCNILNVEIRDTKYQGIRLEEVDDSSIQECYFYRCGDEDGTEARPVYLAHCENIDVIHNYVDKTNVGGYGIASLWSSPYCSNIKVIGNSVFNGYDMGTSICDAININGNNCVISNNYVYNQPASGIDVHGDHNTVANNIVDHCGQGTGGTWGAIHFTGGALTDFTIIANNQIISSGMHGIMAGVVDADVGRCIIIGNYIYDADSSGIKMRATKSVVSGNTIISGAQVTTHGIEFTRGSSINNYSIISNNHIEDCTYGISESNHDYLAIRDNVFLNCGTALNLSSSNHNQTDNVTW